MGINVCGLNAKATEMPEMLVADLTDTVPSSLHIDSIAAINNDSIEYAKLARKYNPDWWLNRLRSGTLNLADKSIIYPRFVGFCVDVYNWADVTFNGTDPEYIEGTGRRWKATLKSDNWLDSYAMVFRHNIPVWMFSDPYCNAGFWLSYMAVSVGYSLDMSNVIGNRPANHKKWDFNFSCARFWFDLYSNSNTGGTFLRRFGGYKDGRIIHREFSGVKFKNYGIDGYFFFNSWKYSQGAAYSFSRIQRRSAGSFILGLDISKHDINVDFSSLPEDMLQYIEGEPLKYRFLYTDYAILVGYGYNWVFAKNLLLNITALPAVGFKHSFSESSTGRADMWSLGFKGRLSITYNLGDFFAGFQGKVDGHWFRGKEYNFFNSIENMALIVGVRF